MKQIGLLILLMFFLASCGGDQDVVVGNKTTMTVDPVYNAGKVLKGEVINAKFTIKNTGKYPLVIAEVKGSCSCTVAEYPDEPILPGKNGVILAHVNTDQTGAGKLNKSVRIVANTNPSITQVMIEANIINK